MNLDSVFPHTHDTPLWAVLHAFNNTILQPRAQGDHRLGQIRQRENKKKQKNSYHPTASSLILSQANHHMTYCN